jgi:Tfp pilus assembly protein PilN
MKAVNLIPADAKRGSGGASRDSQLPTYLLLGVLVAAVALVTVYVLSSNKISQRQAQVTTLKAEVAQAKAQSSALSHYAQFAQEAQSRVASVRQLADTRFDWHATLVDLSKVVPANTSLQSINGSSVAASSTAATPSGTGAASGPTIQLLGCTDSQDDVARLMSRLRLIDGVNSVALASTQKQGAGAGGAVSGASASGSSDTCGVNGPSFDLNVTFGASSGAATSAVTPSTASPSTAASGAGSPTPSTTGAAS